MPIELPPKAGLFYTVEPCLDPSPQGVDGIRHRKTEQGPVERIVYPHRIRQLVETQGDARLGQRGTECLKEVPSPTVEGGIGSTSEDRAEVLGVPQGLLAPGELGQGNRASHHDRGRQGLIHRLSQGEPPRRQARDLLEIHIVYAQDPTDLIRVELRCIGYYLSQVL